MKLGAFSILFNDLPLPDTLDIFAGLGLACVEVGSSGYSRSNHIRLDALYENRAEIKAYEKVFRDRGITISALNAAGNPIHPNAEIAAAHHAGFEKSVVVAAELGVPVVNALSGVPGGSPKDQTPNWIVGPWPEEFYKAWQYQWNDVLLPYWQKADDFAKRYGVKIAIEPHPNFCVYNVESMLRLRGEIGENLGCNFDLSHFLWQGVDPVVAIQALGDAIFHCHAKDVKVSSHIVAQNGILDPKPYSFFRSRAWNFRGCGYGNGADIWRGVISALAEIRFHGTISIEHEDALLTRREGLEKAVAFLRGVIIQEPVETMWWEMRPEG